jgi:hypothetical protein
LSILLATPTLVRAFSSLIVERVQGVVEDLCCVLTCLLQELPEVLGASVMLRRFRVI